MRQGEMLATRWFVTILFVLCAALLTDFCRCATVTKEAGLELKDDFNEDFDNDFGKGASTEDNENLPEVHHDDDEEDAEDLPEDEGADDGEDNGEQDTEDRDYVGEDKGDEKKDESIYEDDHDLEEEDDFGEFEGDEIKDQDEEEDEEKGGDLSYETAMEGANELEILPRDGKNKNEGKISRLKEN